MVNFAFSVGECGQKAKTSREHKETKKVKYDPYENDPSDSVCPYCGQKSEHVLM